MGCVSVIGMVFITNSHCFPIHHQVCGYHSGDGMCLLCAANWIFINDLG